MKPFIVEESIAIDGGRLAGDDGLAGESPALTTPTNMSISFDCDCGKAYKVADKYAGRTINCKACGEPIKVPKAGAASKPQAAPPRKGGGPPPVVSSRSKPAKKKKSSGGSKRSADSGGMSTATIGVLIGSGLFGLGVMAFGIYSLGGSKRGDGPRKIIAAPAQMATFQSEHGGFSSDYPESWSAEGGGGTGGVPPWARFSDETATFEIRANRRGTSIGDIASAGGQSLAPGEELPEELAPVAAVHELMRDKFELDYSDYEETPPKKIEIPFGEGRISTFTGGEGVFGSTVKGYRLTLLGSNHQFNVIGKCPEDDWDTYQATFDKMIESIGR